MKPTLFLIPSFIGEYGQAYLPQNTLEQVYALQHFIVEREKTTRAFLKAIAHPIPQEDFSFFELDKHRDYSGFQTYFDQQIQTNSIGLVSEAGLPAVADPGAEIVAYAHSRGVEVRPLSGSSSIFLALMGSGMDGQHFCFRGYLPIEKQARIKALKSLEQEASKATQIFMEAPYRNNAFLEFLLQNLRPDTHLCIAADLEMPGQTIISKKVASWNKGEIDLNKRPGIFLIKR